MTARPTITMTGGEELEKLLKRARNAKKAPRIAAGYLPSTKFSGGGKVAPVAAQLERGRARPKQPARPFFRGAIPAIAKAVRAVVRERIDPQTLEITPELANEIGQAAVAEINRAAGSIASPALGAGHNTTQAQARLSQTRAAGRCVRRACRTLRSTRLRSPSAP